ncbi:MAG: uracil-DNA glycosylase family protein [Halolamina sp.]
MDAERMDGPCVVDCERCPALVESRSRIVNGVGPADADLLLLGEAPGANEDEQGEPFVGRSGDVLDDALEEAGVSRSEVRISNCVRCRPPENRDPHVDELDNCSGYLARELSVVDPDVVLTLGKVPGEHLLERSLAVTSQAGETFDARVGDRQQRVMVCLHPAATLYDASQSDRFEEVVAEAASLAGIGGDDGDGQSRLGQF